jgi:hypothetical protein
VISAWRRARRPKGPTIGCDSRRWLRLTRCIRRGCVPVEEVHRGSAPGGAACEAHFNSGVRAGARDDAYSRTRSQARTRTRAHRFNADAAPRGHRSPRNVEPPRHENTSQAPLGFGGEDWTGVHLRQILQELGLALFWLLRNEAALKSAGVDRPRDGGSSGTLPECAGQRRRTAPSARCTLPAIVGLEGPAHAHRRPDRRECRKLDPGMHSSEQHGIMLLRQRVDAWASRLKVTPRLVRVQRMTRKWGSCSARGTITLAFPDLCRVARCAESSSRQGPAEGHGGTRPCAFGGSGRRGHGRDPRGSGSTEIRGTTPCNYICTGRRNAEREPGAVNRASRQQCRTAGAGCTGEARRAPRKVTRTPSSTDATRLRRLQIGARSRRFCRR